MCVCVCVCVCVISSVNSKIEAIYKFIIYNMEATQLWVTLYEQKRVKCDSERKEFIWLNGRSVPYPDHLKENMEKICPNSWVADQVREIYSSTSCYPHVEEDVLNVGIGCSNLVIIFLIYM